MPPPSYHEFCELLKQWSKWFASKNASIPQMKIILIVNAVYCSTVVRPSLMAIKCTHETSSSIGSVGAIYPSAVASEVSEGISA